MSLVLCVLLVLTWSASVDALDLNTLPDFDPSMDAIIKKMGENSTYLINEHVCPKMDIRKSRHFKQLTNCTVIEGNLHIVIKTTKQYSFPKLKEITGSILIYYFEGCVSLAELFPNLAIIRGQSLAFNYALAVKDTDLRAIDLPSLRVIERGGVRLDSNTALCHIYSIDWRSIVREKDASIRLIRSREICPDSCPKGCPTSTTLDGETREVCWSTKNCQTLCDPKCDTCEMARPRTCCHPECKAGCYGPGPNRCVTCKNTLHKGVCISKCPAGFYKYLKRRCITKEECFKFEANSEQEGRQPYSLYNGECIAFCSLGYSRDPETGFCKPCTPNCPKKRCKDIMISSLTDLDYIKDCHSAEEVYISIREGGESLMAKLEDAFSELREIKTHIRIIRSQSIVSLNFLRNLRIIKGIPNKVAFDVSANENLREIWTREEGQEKLLIANGSVAFHLNRHLCIDKIISFVEKDVKLSRVVTADEKAVINNSNGDLVDCHIEKIPLVVYDTFSNEVVLKWPYLVNTSRNINTLLIMIKKTEKNVSLYEDRTACGSNAWLTKEVNRCSSDKDIEMCSFTLGELDPAARYAVYIEGKTFVQARGVVSDVVYFRTKAATPSHPRSLELETLSSSEIRVTWKPPVHPNGVITKYFIWYRALPLDPEEFMLRDFCYQKPRWETNRGDENERATMERRPQNQWVLGNASSCTCEMCTRVCRRNLNIEHSIDSSFEDSLHNILFNYKPELSVSQKWMDTKLCMQDRITDVYKCLQNFEKYNMTSYINDTNYDYKTYKGSLWMTDLHGNPLPNDDQMSNVSGGMTPRPSPVPSKLGHSRRHNWVARMEVPATLNSVVITNLEHFTEYIVEIQACQNQEPDNNIRLCSPRVIVSQRTKANMTNDYMNHTSIEATTIESSYVLIKWPSPLYPNGVVLYYLLRYRYIDTSKNESSWITKCIPKQDWNKYGEKGISTTSPLQTTLKNSTKSSRYKRAVNSRGGKNLPVHYFRDSADLNASADVPDWGGIQLADLKPGNYEYQIIIVTLAGNSSWTPKKLFTISGVSNNNHIVLIIVLLFTLTLIILVLVIGIGVQQRRQKYLLQHTWVTPNPDYCSTYDLDDWELDRSDIDTLNWAQALGRGSFGVVYKCVLKKITTPAKDYFTETTNIEVAVKTIKKSSSIYERREFINEACHMKQFQAFHLVRLLGVVSKYCAASTKETTASYEKDDTMRLLKMKHVPKLILGVNHPVTQQTDPSTDNYTGMPLVVMELMANGDLASFLRHMGDDGEGIVSREQTLLWAAQIADGMAYLSSLKFIHRDLAARNCMVDNNLIVKIGDFGLARDIYDSNYYRKEGRGKMPIRWMAPESLKSAYFTTKSDVWSYGVVLWEIITLASLPYRGMSHEEVMKYVVMGNHLVTNGFPTKCPEFIASIMSQCWKYRDKHRPTFFEILSILECDIDEAFRHNSFYFNRDRYAVPKVDNDIPPGIQHLMSMDDDKKDTTLVTELYGCSVDSPILLPGGSSPSPASAPITRKKTHITLGSRSTADLLMTSGEDAVFEDDVNLGLDTDVDSGSSRRVLLSHNYVINNSATHLIASETEADTSGATDSLIC